MNQVFVPVSDVDDKEITTHSAIYEDLWKLIKSKVPDDLKYQQLKAYVLHQLRSGKLKPCVYLANDPASFYRIPTSYWAEQGFLEGELSDQLFCWSDSSVPTKFHDAAVVFFRDEVDQWMKDRDDLVVDDTRPVMPKDLLTELYDKLPASTRQSFTNPAIFKEIQAMHPEYRIGRNSLERLTKDREGVPANRPKKGPGS